MRLQRRHAAFLFTVRVFLDDVDEQFRPEELSFAESSNFSGVAFSGVCGRDDQPQVEGEIRRFSRCRSRAAGCFGFGLRLR